MLFEGRMPALIITITIINPLINVKKEEDARGEHVEGGEHPEGADDGVEEVDDFFVLCVV